MVICDIRTSLVHRPLTLARVSKFISTFFILKNTQNFLVVFASISKALVLIESSIVHIVSGFQIPINPTHVSET